MKSAIKSKVFLIVLSLIPFFNGLGLVYAGKKTRRMKWMGFGILYIVGEWVLAFTKMGALISFVIAMAAIIHTALICHEYEYSIQQGKAENKNVPNSSIQSSVELENKQEKMIQINDMQIDIGSASIQGITRDNLDIRITDTTGKVYSFKSKGNQIISFKVGASSVKSYI